jgi:hypothetical protein
MFAGATGATTSVTFTAPGEHVIGLRVTSAKGDEATAWHTVVVDGPGAPERPQAAPLLSPFPIVTLGGRLTHGETRVNLFRVEAPICSSVSVTCAGRRCPFETVSGLLGHRTLRLRGAERRFRAGTRLVVAISRGGRVGKLTEFRMRRNRPPVRADRCLLPGATRGTTCPGG